jgi:hypothetical protein
VFAVGAGTCVCCTAAVIAAAIRLLVGDAGGAFPWGVFGLLGPNESVVCSWGRGGATLLVRLFDRLITLTISLFHLEGPRPNPKLDPNPNIMLLVGVLPLE